MTDDKAYLVSTGSYSDYRVVAVFSSKEKADKYANSSLNQFKA